MSLISEARGALWPLSSARSSSTFLKVNDRRQCKEYLHKETNFGIISLVLNPEKSPNSCWFNESAEKRSAHQKDRGIACQSVRPLTAMPPDGFVAFSRSAPNDHWSKQGVSMLCLSQAFRIDS
jgi:hypothetical protein